jgi:acyl transferase domain-containing protein/NAD(P)H-dependent flavin oxidoreductase YrpB (nitropropane dioxygenase family)
MSMQIVVSSPSGFPSVRLVRAAHAAGLTGIAGLEHSAPDERRRVIADLVRRNVQFTVSLQSLDHAARATLAPAIGAGLAGVVISNAADPRLSKYVRWLIAQQLRAWVEVKSLDEARKAEAAGAQAIVAKGNESGGAVGEETTFVLLQHVLPHVNVPVYARGGIGIHSAAACLAAGAAGVVLDWQLALCEEAELPDAIKTSVAAMDGSETAILGQDCGIRYRVYARPNQAAFVELRNREERDVLSLHAWRSAIDERATAKELLLIGQDAAFAAHLTARWRTLSSICNAIQRESLRQCRVAAHLDPLGEGSALARSHGTRFPIVQGPMTRVSDTPEFAAAVADGGGLPFLALALMRRAEVDSLLDRTKCLLGDKPWGVGILGFVPQELRTEQLEGVRRHTPPFAIIAGGRPDQARALEQTGTVCYLHVPSPDLLRTFLEGGARRFVFEGRECGGHVGPRTSFILWDSMVRVILNHLAGSADARPHDYHVLFAGGLHDARSSAMASAIAAPLAERGVNVGALLGTGYLFTREAVETGAIQEGFQQEAVACGETILLESGVGHATRCAHTAFGRQFAVEKRRLAKEGQPKEHIREALETLNLGRLRIAAKGITRGAPGDAGAPTYVTVEDDQQRREGMYMIGQVAALRDRVCTIAALHADVCRGREVIEAALAPRAETASSRVHRNPHRSRDIAIVGLSCIFPKAGDLDRFWHNILSKTNAIGEVPKERWDADLYFDADRRARDRIYSRWGGFLDDVTFDPVRYGMPPASVPSVDPLQLVTLEVARRALGDAGYLDRSFDRERTSVVVGTGGGVGELGLAYGFRSEIPHFLSKAGRPLDEADKLIDELGDALPEWTEDSFAGLLLNVAAGRVANRFDLGGTNYVVDAACATSLAAVRLAATELECHSSNVAVAAGADTMQTAFGYLCFSKTQALSPTGQCRTFDDSADGIVISEGVAVAVLKRLDDAVRDGDHIYAVLKAVGASSDGKDKGLTAPRPIGQIRALQRAYEHADVAPATVDLIEAHGTGTVVGDRTEIESLSTFFTSADAPPQSCALGSVKSMIGHTKCTAGFAGLVKAALALHYKVLPPTIGVTQPNTKANLDASPFYLNTEPRPWFKRTGDSPRRAGVSAFGFGGTNFHAVLEEYVADANVPAPPALKEWPAELFVWRGPSARDIATAVESLAAALGSKPDVRLADLAAAVCWEHGRKPGEACLAIAATSLDDLGAKLEIAKPAVTAGSDLVDPRGVYFRMRASTTGKVAFVFPGQGSQRVNMLMDLAVAIPSCREVFERADEAVAGRLDRSLTNYVFPRPTFDAEQEKAAQVALTNTRVAQPALGAADLAMYGWLSRLGIEPDMACGHSYGELAALSAAGAIAFDDLIRLSEARGRAIVDGARDELGTMAAIEGPEPSVCDAIGGVEGVYLANVNTPAQTVIAGTKAGVDEGLRRLAARGISGKSIPVAAAFHSPLIAGAEPIFAAALAECRFAAPRFPVYSNTTAAPHAQDATRMPGALVQHMLRPVRFADQIRAMHGDGARTFIEVGPGRVLTGLISQTLAGTEHDVIPMDQPGRHGLVQLTHALAQIAACGVRFHLQPLSEGRRHDTRPLAALLQPSARAASPTTWTIKAGRAVPPAQHTTVNRPASTAIAPRRPIPAPAPAMSSAPTPVVAAIPVVASVANAATESVMTQHHRLMSKFLETHRNVMLASLGAAAPVASVPAPVATTTPVAQPAATRALAAAAPPPLEVIEPAPVAASAAGPMTSEDVLRALVTIVSERTGYPADMLGVNLDLEADLGVDSIKRVEIFSALQSQGLLPQGDIAIEALSKLKTLRAIADWIASVPAAGEEPTADREEVTARAEVPLNRLTLATAAAPRPTTAPTPPSGVVVITDDGRSIAHAVSASLTATGVSSAIVRLDGSDAATALAAVRRAHGRVGALLHLAPLGGELPQSDAAFLDRLNTDLAHLFEVCRVLESDLRESSGSVIAATALGGTFGIGVDDGWLGSGAVSGFIKTLAFEWPDVCCRTVDFQCDATVDSIAEALLFELGCRDEGKEVGYSTVGRVAPATIEAPLERNAVLSLDAQAVVLVTGGARGITAATALEIAERFRPTLVLVGRSPLADEAPEYGECRDERELKTALINRVRARGETPPLAAIDAECKSILRAREARANIAAIRRAGAIVEYHAVDVGDRDQFAALTGDVYARLGRIDGVIHGAGIIEDRLIRDKTPQSVARVLQPKVAGALTLASALKPESLKFLVFFSSVSARYGNRGQSDYAAANEVLNKLAASLSRRWPARVVSINWGPWDSPNGMVSAALAERFAEAGVTLVPMAEGRRALIDELLYGTRTEAEVVWQGARPEQRAGLPLLCRPHSSEATTSGSVSIALESNAEIDKYLADHVLDDTPVMPAAVAMELMAEAAAANWPGLVVSSVSDLRVLNGISYPQWRARALRLELSGVPESSASTVRIGVSIGSIADRPTVHYRADVTLTSALEATSPVTPLAGLGPVPSAIGEGYRQWLFHGPALQGISALTRIGEKGITARLRPSEPRRLLGGNVTGAWLIDPVVIDSALQLLIVWARTYLDQTPLPSRLGRYHRYAQGFPPDVVCEADIEHVAGSSTLRCQIRLFDDDRRLLGWLEDMEVTCSQALNRLTSAVPARAGV